VVLSRYEELVARLTSMRNERVQAWREECDEKCHVNLNKPLFLIKQNKDLCLNYDPQVIFLNGITIKKSKFTA